MELWHDKLILEKITEVALQVRRKYQYCKAEIDVDAALTAKGYSQVETVLLDLAAKLLQGIEGAD